LGLDYGNAAGQSVWNNAYLQQKADFKSRYGDWGPGMLSTGSKLVPGTPLASAQSLAGQWIMKANLLTPEGRAFNSTVTSIFSQPTVMKAGLPSLSWANSVAFWDAVNKLATAKDSQVGLPGFWSIAWESTSEAVVDVAKDAGQGLSNLADITRWLLKYGPYLGVGLAGLYVWSMFKKRSA
jgi:hypothetical protein